MAAATPLRFVALAVAVLAAAAALPASVSREGKQYKVGGPDGWCVPPPEEKETYYANWASSITFYVDDSIEFVYKNDSVIQVDKAGYYHCNGTAGAAPRDGRTHFRLDAPGYAYFASADVDHCEMGERLMINVVPAGQPSSPQAPRPWSWLMPAPGPSAGDATAAGHSVAASSVRATALVVPVTLALAGLL